jgi:hypothetical protein
MRKRNVSRAPRHTVHSHMAIGAHLSISRTKGPVSRQVGRRHTQSRQPKVQIPKLVEQGCTVRTVRQNSQWCMCSWLVWTIRSRGLLLELIELLLRSSIVARRQLHGP